MKNIGKISLFLFILLSSITVHAEDYNEKQDDIQNEKQNNETINNENYKETYYFPYIVGNILTEYNFSSLTKNKYGNKLYTDEKNIGYLNIESKLNIYFLNHLSLKNTLIFKPISDRLNDTKYIYNDFYGKEDYLKRRIYFNKYDIIFEELALEYKEEQFLFGVGKYNPTFGTAYDKAKYHGIFDTRISENYELTEKIGFYIAMILPMFNLRFNSFYNDTEFLSKSLFGTRDRYNAIIGAGNTKKLNNFSISSDFAIYDWKINFGIRRLAVNNLSEKAEKGYVFGLEKLIIESENEFGFIPFTEFSYIENYNGTKDRNISFFTLRLPIYYGGWNLIGIYSLNFDHEKNFKNYKNYIAELTLGYKFDSGLMLDVSKSIERETDKISKTKKNSYKLDAWAVRVSYMINFDGK